MKYNGPYLSPEELEPLKEALEECNLRNPRKKFNYIVNQEMAGKKEKKTRFYKVPQKKW